jgi:pimeloyl-ACP methyl ester carboxylesterase
MRLASVTDRIGPVSEKIYDGISTAGEAVCEGAETAYQTALKYPKTSIGGFVLAAALIGGALWYIFGREQPAQRARRHAGARARAGSERRKRQRPARASATA